jgi:hypothetical protein
MMQLFASFRAILMWMDSGFALIIPGLKKQIRVSFYILGFLTPFVARFHKSKEVTSSFQNALGANSLAILISAVVQTVRHQLTLFHAICVIHLVTFLGLTTLSSKHDNRRLSLRGIVGMILYFTFLLFFTGFNLYVWITAPTFGSQPNCNASTVYVLLGADIHPTDPAFRWLIVAATCLTLLSIILFSTAFANTLTKYIRKTSNSVQQEGVGEQGYLVFGSLIHLGGWVYAVVAFEQTLQSNNLSPNDFEWSFGQILAIVLLIGPLFNLITVLHDESESKHENHELRALVPRNTEEEARNLESIPSGRAVAAEDESGQVADAGGSTSRSDGLKDKELLRLSCLSTFT